MAEELKDTVAALVEQVDKLRQTVAELSDQVEAMGQSLSTNELRVDGNLKVVGDLDVEGKLGNLIDVIADERTQTKAEIADGFEDLTNQVTDLRHEHNTEITALQTTVNDQDVSLKDSISATKTELQTEITNAVAELETRIEDGRVVAQRAVMLKERDNNHWLRVRGQDRLYVFRVHDRTWHDRVIVRNATRAERAEMLEEMDGNHCLKYDDTSNGYDLWRRTDSTWHHRYNIKRI